MPGLNPVLEMIAESATLALNARVRAMQRAGTRVANLTVGELDFITPPSVRKAVRARLSENKYAPTLGLVELRQGIARAASRMYRLRISEANVAVTAGVKQALFETFQALLRPGDQVIIPTPAWVSYEHAVRLAGGEPVFVPLSASCDLDPRAVLSRFTSRTKAVVINSPHNPTGAVFSAGAVRAVSEGAASRSAFVFSDDIYNTLVYTKSYAAPAAFAGGLEHLVIFNGFSKSHALTGWRIGYLLARPEIVEAVGKIQSHTTGNAAIMSQYAGLAALSDAPAAREFRRILRRRRDVAVQGLSGIAGLRLLSPQGAFYAWADIRELDADADRFAARLLEEAGVAVVPGSAFRAPGHLRISFARPDRELRTALSAIGRFAASYRP